MATNRFAYDLLARGSQWLESMRSRHVVQRVIYRRGEQNITLFATIGRTEFEQDDRTGAIIRSQIRDYLINVSDLLLNEKLIVPERGDHIEEEGTDTRFIFEVVSLGSGSHWRYSDPYRQVYRIHTRQVGTKLVS